MAANAEPTTVDYFIQLLKNKVQSSKPQLKATLPKVKTKGNPATNQNNKQPYHKSKQLGIWRAPNNKRALNNNEVRQHKTSMEPKSPKLNKK